MSANGTVALDVAGVTRSFGGVQALGDVSFQAQQGTITAVVGPNGAGKTTLFNVLTNLYPPQSGRVYLFGADLHGRPPDAVAHLGMVRTFQTARVFPGMNVLENTLVGAHLSVRNSGWAQAVRLPGVRKEEQRLRERALALLDLLGLADQRNEPAVTLSVGSQKLLEIARALMAEPRVLLLDEPAAGLNDSETAELAEMLVALRAAGLTVLVVEHNMTLVMGVADQVVVLDAGGVIAIGEPAQVQRNERVIEAYLGQEREAAP